MGLRSTEHDCPSWEPVVPAECELGAREHPPGVSGATMWLVQDHHSVADLHRLRSTGSDRWLIAIPSHRSDWKSELHSLCTQEQAWLAVSGVRARPIHRWTHPHTTTPYGRQRKRQHCYDTLVDWYIVGTTWDIDIHRYIATLSQLSGRGKHRATWYMPPRSLHTTAGKATDKHVFFHAWHSLREERKSLYQTRFSSRDLARNLESTLAILPLSPLNWHRKMLGLSQAWDLHIDQRSCTVYAVVSDFSATIYIGQTGGKQKLRSLLKRFGEHIRAGLKFEKKKHRFSAAEISLYEAMHKYGPEHFFIMPMQLARKQDIDTLEMDWINTVGGRVYNVRTECRWKSASTFKRFFQPCENPPEGTDWNAYANALIQRRGVGLPTLIYARSRGKRSMSKHNYALLEQRLFELTLSRTGTRLPKAIAFPYPPSNEPETTARPLLSFIHAIYHDIPVPTCVKEYLRSVTRLVAKRAHKLGELLCVKGTKHSWAELQETTDCDCTCASLPPHLPRVFLDASWCAPYTAYASWTPLGFPFLRNAWAMRYWTRKTHTSRGRAKRVTALRGAARFFLTPGPHSSPRISATWPPWPTKMPSATCPPPCI